MQRPPAVPLADAEVAAGIARTVAKGGPAERSPTIEQLLAAFGEAEPTDAARRRVRDALAVADLAVEPDVLQARPGERVLLRAIGPAALSGGPRGRAFLGLVALGGILVAAAIAAGVAGQDGDGVRDALPPAPTTTFAATPPDETPAQRAAREAREQQAREEQGTRRPADAATTPPATTDAATTPTAEPGTTPAATTDAATTPTAEPGTTPTATTQATTTPESDDRAAKPAARRRAAAPKRLTVRLIAPRPTYLCVEDQRGRRLFAGTLAGARAFRGKDLRFNIGLASTQVRVNGRVVRLSGSPTGIRVRGRGTVTPLPLGSRPC